MLTCVSSSEGNLFLELLAESVVAYTILLDDEHTVLDNLVNLNSLYVLNSGMNRAVEFDLVGFKCITIYANFHGAKLL